MTEPRIDVEGTEINVGDVVWIIRPNYRELEKAVIIKFTPQACKVLVKDPYTCKVREFLVYEMIRCKDQTMPEWFNSVQR